MESEANKVAVSVKVMSSIVVDLPDGRCVELSSADATELYRQLGVALDIKPDGSDSGDCVLPGYLPPPPDPEPIPQPRTWHNPYYPHNPHQSPWSPWSPWSPPQIWCTSGNTLKIGGGSASSQDSQF